MSIKRKLLKGAFVLCMLAGIQHIGGAWILSDASEKKDEIVEEFKTRRLDELDLSVGNGEISAKNAKEEQDRIKYLSKKESLKEIKTSKYEDLKEDLNSTESESHVGSYITGLGTGATLSGIILCGAAFVKGEKERKY